MTGGRARWSPSRWGAGPTTIPGPRPGEAWYGTHPAGRAPVSDCGAIHSSNGTHPAGRTRLADGASPAALIDSGPPPQRLLGEDVVRRFGARLPCLLTIIAPQRALSPRYARPGSGRRRIRPRERGRPGPGGPRAQIQGRRPQARDGPGSHPLRGGSRAPRRAVEVLSGLDSAPAHRMRRTLRLSPTRFGIRQVLTDPHRPGRRPGPPQRPGDRGAGGADRRSL